MSQAVLKQALASRMRQKSNNLWQIAAGESKCTSHLRRCDLG
jgi:hypothetical protein